MSYNSCFVTVRTNFEIYIAIPTDQDMDYILKVHQCYVIQHHVSGISLTTNGFFMLEKYFIAAI